MMFRLFSEGWGRTEEGGQKAVPVLNPFAAIRDSVAGDVVNSSSKPTDPAASQPTFSATNPSPSRLLEQVKLPEWLRRLPEVPASSLVDHLQASSPRLVDQLTALGPVLFPTLGKDSIRLADFVLYLRPTPLQQLAFAIGVVDQLTADLNADWQSRARARALVAACTAHVWRRRTTPQSTNSPFGLALLRSVGIAIMLQQLGSTYHQFLEAVAAQRANQRRLETLTLGFDHFDVTEHLFEQWCLHEFYHDHEAHRPAVVLAEHASEALIESQSHALEEFLAHSRKEQVDAPQLQVMMAAVEQQVHEMANRLQWPLTARPMLGQSLTMLLAQRTALSRIGSPPSPQSDTVGNRNAVGNNSVPPRENSRDGDATMLNMVSNPGILPEQEESKAKPNPPSTDPATLLNDKTAQFTAQCRRQRELLSLSLIKVDGLETWLSEDAYEINCWTNQLLAVVRNLCDQTAEPVLLQPGLLAILQPRQDRSAAVATAKQVLHCMCRGSVGKPGSGISLSAGVASVGVPPKNFLPEELIRAAERCLHAAQISGGGAIKSIDIL
ncbi:MAG: hypothetical protein RIS70_3947 [Planctomycetota bacterium]